MRENLPLVSVTMACYNHEKYVAQAIESVLNQTYPNIELIVADNGSLDNSYEIIKRYEGKVKKILRLEKNDRKKCTNMLFAETSGSYFTVMTSDDYWEPDKVELQMKAFRENPNVGVCATWAVYADENLVPISDKNVFIQENRSRAEWIRYFLENGNCIAYASVIMDMELRKKVLPGINRGYSQLADYYWWICLIQETDFYIVPKILMRFRWHLSGSNRNESAPSEENDIRVRNEHADILSHVFQHIPDQLFLQAFKDVLINPDARTEEEIMCEKFFALLRLAEQKYYYQPCVERFYHDHYRKISEEGQRSGLEEPLERIYHYSGSDFSKWSGRTGIAKYYYDLKNVIAHYEQDIKYLELLQDFCLAGKEGKEYESCISEMKKLRFLSLPDEKQKLILAVYECSERVFALQRQLDTIEYGAVIESLQGLATGIDMVLEDLGYLDWEIKETDWSVFKELIQCGRKEQIDLTESVFPFLNLICESLRNICKFKP